MFKLKGLHFKLLGTFNRLMESLSFLNIQVFPKHQDLKNLRLDLEIHSEPSQTSEMEHLETIVNSFKLDLK